MSDKPSIEEFKIEIVADHKKADQLYSMLQNQDMKGLPLPPIPISAIKDFIDDKRDSIWIITVAGEDYMKVVADKPSASALLKMIKGAGKEEFPLATLPASNLRSFVNGQRDNLATLEIRKNNDVKVQVKPEKSDKSGKAGDQNG